MRFPSLFRLPRSQQFEIKPRYYDPVKEFVKEREMLAKSRKDSGSEDSAPRIAFNRRQSSAGLSASLLQLIIALLLGSLVVGWLYIGNDIVYFGLLLAPLYLYFRFRKK